MNVKDLTLLLVFIINLFTAYPAKAAKNSSFALASQMAITINEEASEDEFNSRHDSIVKALYPPIQVVHFPDSLWDEDPNQKDLDGNDFGFIRPNIPGQSEEKPISPIDLSLSTGAIDIISGVSPTGAKTYEVPIKVYPGINDFQPKLSINYNSQQGLSSVGDGWNIGGVPMIIRGGKNLYYDGVNEGLKMDETDSFYLDGVRLLKISEETGKVINYESEQNNIKVKGYLSDSKLKYFEVLYPDGRKAILGFEDNNTNQLYYPITTISDINGNVIKYEYITGGGLYNISEIKYGKSVINFKYDDADYNILSFVGARMTAMLFHLNEIEIKYNENSVGKYSFTYDLNNNREYLTKIDYSSDQERFNPLKFSYGFSSSNNGYEVSNTKIAIGYEFPDPNRIKIIRGRFDSESNDDGIIIFPIYNPYYYVYKKKTLFSKEVNKFENVYETQYHINDKIYCYTNLNDTHVFPEQEMKLGKGFIDALCADIQGRQKDFIVKINNFSYGVNDSLIFTVYGAHSLNGLAEIYKRKYCLKHQFVDASGVDRLIPKFHYAGDFNGDGRQEILTVSANNPFINHTNHPTDCYLFDLENNKMLYEGRPFEYNVSFISDDQQDSHVASNNSDKLFVVDIDGDGKTDICLINNVGFHIYTFDVNSDGSMRLKLMNSTNTLNRAALINKEMSLGDFNGDGLVDIVVSSEKGAPESQMNWRTYHSKGNGTFYSTMPNGPANLSDGYSGFLSFDIDGDGVSDLFRYDSNGFNIYKTYRGFVSNIGERFESNNMVLVPCGVNRHNSFSQLIGVKDLIITRYESKSNVARSRLLRSMINSLGANEVNTYHSLSDKNSKGIYKPGYGAEYPYVNITEPLMVLASVETGIFFSNREKSKVHYEYENAVIHRQGLGFCGFEKVTSYDTHDNPTIKTYDPYNHCVLKSFVSPEMEVTYNHTVYIDKNKVKRIYLDKKTEKNLLTNITADYNYTYDVYGYPTSETIKYSDGVNIKKIIQYAQGLEVSNIYSLGFITDLTTTTTRNGEQYSERIYYPLHLLRKPIVAIKYVNGNQVEKIEYSYDTFGNVLTENVVPYTSNLGLKTTYSYTEEGILYRKTDPWGCTKDYYYDKFGRLSMVGDHTGNTILKYDAFGRKILCSRPDGTQVTTKYEWTHGLGNKLYQVTTEETGKPTESNYYDNFGRLVGSSQMKFDGELRCVDSEYDIHGNLIKESLPFVDSQPSEWIYWEYDRYNRPLSRIEPSGKKTIYRYSGNNVITVENGITIWRSYDSQGLLIASSDPSGEVKYNLAADGQPIYVEAPGGIRYWYYYDKYRRQDCVSDASAGLIRYKYDDWGNVCERTSAGKTMSYEFDDFNRIKKVITPEFTTTYTYDAYNRLSDVSSGNGTSRKMIYDKFGRLSSWREINANGKNLSKDYSYANGNISSITYLTGGGIRLSETYIYSNGTFVEGKINSRTVYKLDAENDYGLPTQITTGNIVRTFDYDNNLPKGRQATINGRYIQNQAYKFDPETSCLLRRQDLVYGLSENFEYDELNRLISAGENTYSYNNWGNIIGKSDVGQFEYELPNKPHALTKITPNGPTVPLKTQDIAYTSFSRPEKISEGDLTASFTYNAFSERVKMEIKRGNSIVQSRYYSGDCYEYIYDADKGYYREKLYLFGNYYDAPIVFVKGDDDDGDVQEDYYYILRDYLGSVTQIVNSSGATVQELSYDAWGKLRDPKTWEYYAEGKEPDLFLGRGYTGHEHLMQFGLINMNARLYDPLVGRFLSPDPYIQMPDFTQNFNRFSYALNNPLCYIDEDGEFFWTFVIGAAVISGVVNVCTHWDAVKSGGLLTGLEYFGIGALAGGVGATIGVGAVVGFGSMLGVTASTYAAATSSFLGGAMSSFADGAVSGFIQSMGNSFTEGNDWGTALLSGIYGAASGGLTGSLNGGLYGGIQASATGKNFWRGSKPQSINTVLSEGESIANKVTGSAARFEESLAKENSGFYVYYGYDKDHIIRYIGITRRDPMIRFQEHWRSGTNRASLKFAIYGDTGNLSKIEARIYEQKMINFYGMQNNGGQLFNLRNSISPKYWEKHGIK